MILEDGVPDTSQPLGPVEVGAVAHGGHCVARHAGRVIFVRHALPGERVMVRITDTRHDRYWRGDAVEILTESPDRREPRCPVFAPGGCGGCDFQHATQEAQRAYKTAVVTEQLKRLGRYVWQGEVEAVAPVWGWRTRMRYQLVEDGPGLRAHRSHHVVPLPEQGCAIASVDPREHLPKVVEDSEREVELLVVDAGDGVRVGPPSSRRAIAEQVGSRAYQLPLSGFWQVHPKAAATLVDAVLTGLAPAAGEHALDLYCGAGLFAGALVDQGVRVTGVESDRSSVAYARRNVPEASFVAGRVEQVLRTLSARADLVVLDPPRDGAGKVVLQQIADRSPRAMAYVACDPAALGRDLAYAGELGWRVRQVRAFDLFPQTHHVECVAILDC